MKEKIMTNLLEMMVLTVACGTGLVALFLILLALPKSKLRTIVMPFVSGAVALACGAYVISPVDVVPEIILGPLGLADDLVMAVIGIMAAQKALSSNRES